MAMGSTYRIRMTSSIGERSYLVEVGKKFLSRCQQFAKEEDTFRIIGKDGPEFVKITREEIAGMFDLQPIGGQLAPNKDVARQQILQGLAISNQSPMMMEISDVYEMWKEFWRTLDVEHPERFVKPPPTKQWEPQHENIVLAAGEFVRVTANEQHDEHIEMHMRGLAGAVDNPKAEERFGEHIAQHRKYLRMAKGQGVPQQEQPGMKGNQGGVPNKPSQPTQGSLEARSGGGTV
jgi:hypothetical protein